MLLSAMRNWFRVGSTSRFLFRFLDFPQGSISKHVIAARVDIRRRLLHKDDVVFIGVNDKAAVGINMWTMLTMAEDVLYLNTPPRLYYRIWSVLLMRARLRWFTASLSAW